MNKIEAEITATQVDFAARMAWLRSNYFPDPVPKAVKDCLEELQGRYDQLRDIVGEMEATLAWQATRNQETVPDEIVGRLLAGGNPIRGLLRERPQGQATILPPNAASARPCSATWKPARVKAGSGACGRSLVFSTSAPTNYSGPWRATRPAAKPDLESPRLPALAGATPTEELHNGW
jgi:hypothetical protein